MGNAISTFFLRALHCVFQNLCLPWYRWCPAPIGLMPIVVHRLLLQKLNLHPAPIEKKDPTEVPLYRPSDGYGTDVENPAAAAVGSPFGRNCSAIPIKYRYVTGDPSPEEISAKLLARTDIKTAFPQFNIIAAAWIQAMVHDWVGHYDDFSDNGGVTLNRGAEFGCPMKSFNFRKTLERPNDDSYNCFRTMWWDASFLYGQTEEAVRKARTFKGGLLKVNSQNPNVLPQAGGLNTTGDNKNSWVGVTLLQELFLKEHNAVATAIAKVHPEFSDEELFGKARLVIAALVAKIHTVDWTVELLKTRTLEVGMKTNWYGLPVALGLPKWLPGFFKLTGQKKANNHKVPYCLTEEFAAVYRLHPMLPDGLYIDGGKTFLPLEELVGEKAVKAVVANKDRPVQFWDSVTRYPCGGLVLQNYPKALRDLAPTEDNGEEIKERVDLAAVDIYRDRERGILKFNDFRRDLRMKPYRSWKHLTGDDDTAELLASVYGENGIENLDLMVGDLAEKKIPGFAISETSFIIFLLMASRRLESDPFLNEYFTPKHYSQTGLDWIENTKSLREVLERHYPEVAKNLPDKNSAFTPFTPWPKTS